jgi:hypothetical protein
VVFSTGKEYSGQAPDDKWVQIQNPPSRETGWVPATDCVQIPDPARPDLDQEGFVRECLIAERIFNNIPSTPPWFVVADYLLARAFIETRITNAGPKIAGSDAIGPLQVSSAEWNNFLQTQKPLSDQFTAADRDLPTMQLYGAACRMQQDAKAVSAAKTQAGGQIYQPTFLDVLHAYLTSSPKAAAAILAAAGTQQDIKQVLDATPLAPADVAAIFDARGQFTGTIGQPKKIGDFIAGTEVALNNALQKGFDLIKQYAPDQVPTTSQSQQSNGTTTPRPQGAVPTGAAHLNFQKAQVPQKYWQFGDMIVDRFEKAGFSREQQIAAVANSIGESGLNPQARATPPEHSYGLFQCNIVHGLGVGYTAEQLFNPDTNIAIVIKEAKKYSDFKGANSVGNAVAAFVKWIERPANTQGATNTRLKIAQRLMS